MLASQLWTLLLAKMLEIIRNYGISRTFYGLGSPMMSNHWYGERSLIEIPKKLTPECSAGTLEKPAKVVPPLRTFGSFPIQFDFGMLLLLFLEWNRRAFYSKLKYVLMV
jgi:hypothetical protein